MILLSGYFFNETLAGIYALASTIGLIIFIGIQPINKALFPITASDSVKEKPNKNNFFKALGIILILSLLALIVIGFFPEFLINIFAGKSLPEAHSIMLILSVGMTLLSVTSFLLYYKLSQGKTSNYQYIALFLVVECILLIVFSQTLLSFALAFLVSNVIFLIGSFFVLNK